MKNVMRFCAIASAGAVLVLTGCGGDGGGGSATPTTATLKLTTATTTPLAGTGVNVAIPLGTTVKTDVNGVVLSSVTAPSGVMANGKGAINPAFVSYSAPTAAKKGSLKFIVINQADNTSFTSGEFATVTCNFTGTAPVKNDFALILQAVDVVGNPVSVNESFSLTIQ